MRPDSDAGPRWSRSLTKIPSRMLPQTLKPRPVKSRLFRPTMLTRLAFGCNDELKKKKTLCSALFFYTSSHTYMQHFIYSFFPHPICTFTLEYNSVSLRLRAGTHNYTISMGFYVRIQTGGVVEDHLFLSRDVVIVVYL